MGEVAIRDGVGDALKDGLLDGMRWAGGRYIYTQLRSVVFEEPQQAAPKPPLDLAATHLPTRQEPVAVTIPQTLTASAADIAYHPPHVTSSVRRAAFTTALLCWSHGPW